MIVIRRVVAGSTVGAHPSGRIGEDPHGHPNNLMPFLAQVAVGRRDHLTIHGNDYPTKDGTSERDYIHVIDLAAGHVAALNHLAIQNDPTRANSPGSGQATTVPELLRAFEEASRRRIPYRVGPRRSGDLATVYADPPAQLPNSTGAPPAPSQKCARTPGAGSPPTQMATQLE